MENKKILVIGAGLTGSSIARMLADSGYEVMVHEKRKVNAGLIHDQRVNFMRYDKELIVSTYGPHIFHTNSDEVYGFISRFTEPKPYKHRVKSDVGNERYVDFPVTQQTISQLKSIFGEEFGENDKSESKQEFNLENRFINLYGYDLYETLFKGYTEKQWGMSPELIPTVGLAGRNRGGLELKDGTGNLFFLDKYVFLPDEGYSAMIDKMLDHKNIEVHNGVYYEEEDLKAIAGSQWYDHIFVTGSVFAEDEFYNTNFEIKDKFNIMGSTEVPVELNNVAVVNYPTHERDYIRATMLPRISPLNQGQAPIIKADDSGMAEFIPTMYEYPERVPTNNGMGQLNCYPSIMPDHKTKALSNRSNYVGSNTPVTFAGRQGGYRYLDMDKAVEEAAKIVEVYVSIKELIG